MKAAIAVGALASVLAASTTEGTELFWPTTGIAALLVLVIRHADWLAYYWLGFGFMESFATDRKNAHQQGPVIKVMAWMALLGLTGLMAYRAFG